ncbi:GH92 family glycosyl hydrolase [Carboxylicivirga sediminis]|uniref:GH92 family glycosyl hydrolase n=1 Tax=Carboxylicivirga sediminis TaxID=2006564 RepID=A0A941F3B7_9BACT|nr:GH92 family glycosyl hydrolase [Carboxylicivirga sediminis]MBR8535554.1 GH92 family glycosyl hydrolase [Carboxylicivirga sediminis]
MKAKILFALIAVAFLYACQPAEKEPRLTDYVDPFIGTGAHGHVFPGATTPFGMVQLSPVNGVSGWDWVSGYHTTSTELVGFAHMCLSGTGIGDLADLIILPTNQVVESDTTAGGKNFLQNYKASYQHDREIAQPGYYMVDLTDKGIKAELTTSRRVGFHRYQFTEGDARSVIVDLGHAINWDRPVETYIKKETDTRFVGYRKSSGWANEQWLFFVIETNQAVKDFQVVKGGELQQLDELTDQDVKAVLKFDESVAGEVKLKVGLSSASIDGARKSIEMEIADWDFEKQRQNASDSWEKELQKIKVTTPEEDVKTIFYTAFYHSMIAPYVHSDHDGEYKGLNGEVNKAEGFERYTVFSLWDTFRASHPLFTIVQEDLVHDFIHSFMAIYRESGLLPVWELVGNETNCMIGYHAIPVIADAWQKGLITDIDGNELLEAMVASAMTDKSGLKYYREYGYLPADLENESVSKALEYAYDDWCIAQMAKSVGNDEVYETFIKRAGFYKNHFDASTGFMRGKLANGEWKQEFDPLYSSHRDDEYVEGNAWQYSWFAPHDIGGLVQLHGGADKFVTKLDSLFSIEEEVKGAHASPDISGLIGQYAHGNEPSHHVAYAYNYVGMPWKTAERANEIMRTMYTTEVDGLCGNEDCGQMSAWYVLSSMGFYPVNPADGNYILGTPLFDEATIALANGKSFVITTQNNSPENIYIQSATLNGQELSRSWFTHEELVNGGELNLVMGLEPNEQWGTSHLPPSMSK